MRISKWHAMQRPVGFMKLIRLEIDLNLNVIKALNSRSSHLRAHHSSCKYFPYCASTHQHDTLLQTFKLNECSLQSMTPKVAASLCREAVQSLSSLDPSNGIALVRIIIVAFRKS